MFKILTVYHVSVLEYRNLGSHTNFVNISILCNKIIEIMMSHL